MNIDRNEQIVVREYDPTWPDQFVALAARVSAALGTMIQSVEHIGSTAVQGLPAKPIIDLDVVLASETDLPEAIRRLAVLGYVHEGDLGIRGREAFAWPAGEARHHLYVLTAAAAELRRHLVFRDALRSDPTLREAYTVLKRSLAEKHCQDREAYNAGKTGFVTAILKVIDDAARFLKRRSARTILMNERHQVLLIRFVAERQGQPFTFWATPGGGVDGHESDMEAARRELREELGLDTDLVGPVHTHTSDFEHEGEMVTNTDVFFIGRCAACTPALRAATQAEAAAMKALRWWSVSELETTEDVVFPSDLSKIVRPFAE